jgi:hypothetical protein
LLIFFCIWSILGFLFLFVYLINFIFFSHSVYFNLTPKKLFEFILLYLISGPIVWVMSPVVIILFFIFYGTAFEDSEDGDFFDDY